MKHWKYNTFDQFLTVQGVSLKISTMFKKNMKKYVAFMKYHWETNTCNMTLQILLQD